MKTIKKIAAVVLALAVIASFASLFTVNAAATNVALGATVTSSNTKATGELELLTDGANKHNSPFVAYNCNIDQYASYVLTFDGEKEFNKVRLCYRSAEGWKRPRDIAIDAKIGNEWVRVSAVFFDGQTDIYAIRGGVLNSQSEASIIYADFYFEAVKATALRVSGSNAGIRAIFNDQGTYNFLLSEIEAFNDTSVTSYTAGTTVDKDTQVTTHIGVQTSSTVKMPAATNYADYIANKDNNGGSDNDDSSTPVVPATPVKVSQGATVTSNNTLASGTLDLLTDGANKHNSPFATCLCDTNQYASYVVTFDGEKEFNKVRLCYRSAEGWKRPRDIAIDAKIGNDWVRVSAVFYDGQTDIYAIKGGNVKSESEANIMYVDFYFEAVKATAIRVSGSNAGIRAIFGGTGTYNFLLSEIEAWNDPSVTSYTAGTTVDANTQVTTHIGVQTSSTVKMPSATAYADYIANKDNNGGSNNGGSNNGGSSNTGSNNNKLPQTGENSNVFAVMAALVAAGFVCVVAAKARKA